MEWLILDNTPDPTPFPLMVLGVLLAFSCGLLLSWVYIVTHSGLSYSRSFASSLIVIPVVVTLVMMVMANNLITAFGLMAVFAMVRFRNILRDTLDTSHILGVIVVGMACGTQKYSTAILAAMVTTAIMLFLWWTSYGTRQRYDTIINLRWERPLMELADLTRLLRLHGQRIECTSQRQAAEDGAIDLSYRLLLRDPSRMDQLLSELRPVPGVSRLSGLKAQDESEA